MSKRAKKPTSVQLRILRNRAAGLPADYGRPFTRSHAAGWGSSEFSCRRAGWLDRESNLTPEGRTILETHGGAV
ncbi:Uncharacterised protein [Starkeya nomas]|uniref:Uncharacterized protein n=1 Tax=Starkeya nomas TaxID=2666134 RepID=A0A5S9R5S2_9HYPH|nr:Uncharacterised protein [Starkeya nomas]